MSASSIPITTVTSDNQPIISNNCNRTVVLLLGNNPRLPVILVIAHPLAGAAVVRLAQPRQAWFGVFKGYKVRGGRYFWVDGGRGGAGPGLGWGWQAMGVRRDRMYFWGVGVDGEWLWVAAEVFVLSR